jgi:hypothetical protein
MRDGLSYRSARTGVQVIELRRLAMDEISKGTSPTGRRVISGATAALALLLAACGTQTIAGLPSPDPALMSYEWQLPSLDLTGSGPDGAVYQALQTSCDAGANALAQQWAQTSGPRTVLLFAAGAELCRGQLGAARIYYNRAHGEYGWGGLASVPGGVPCSVYKSVASVVEQASPEQIQCVAGPNPGFRRSATGVADNPLTAEDESAVGDGKPQPGAGGVPADPGVGNKAPVKPAPVKPAPVKPAPVKPAPVKPAPAKPVPEKPKSDDAKPKPGSGSNDKMNEKSGSGKKMEPGSGSGKKMEPGSGSAKEMEPGSGSAKEMEPGSE